MHIFAEADASFLTHLQQKGFAVVTDILGPSNYTAFLDEFWKAMEHVTPGVKKADVSTWSLLPKGNKGLVSDCGVPQADFAWRIRQSSKVKSIFATIFKTDELVVSLDSVIIQALKQKTKRPSWLHKDQSPELPEGHSFQGIYSYYSSCEQDAGTCLVPESHRVIYDWEWTLPQSDRDRNFLLAPDQKVYQAVKPDVPANALLVFDSRLLHASVDAMTGKQGRLERLAIPVAMAPATRRGQGTKRKKEDLYYAGKASSHWPCDRMAPKRIAQWCYTIKGVKLPPPKADRERLALM